MAAGDRLWNLREDLWVVAPSRAAASWYLVAGQQVYIAADDRWEPDDLAPLDYLTLCHPDDDVHLEDADGNLYNETAERFAARVPSGTIVDERFEGDEEDDEYEDSTDEDSDV